MLAENKKALISVINRTKY